MNMNTAMSENRDNKTKSYRYVGSQK